MDSVPRASGNTQQVSDPHYAEVADKYDSLCAITMSNFLPIIQEALQLKPDDVLVDIGGGTGWYAHHLWKAAGLKEPVVCVDPSAEMLEVAKRQKGVTTFQATAEEFFSRPQEKLFTKALSMGAIHHFSDLGAVLKGVWNSLAPGGSFVIQTLSPMIPNDLPLFRAALGLYATFNYISEDELIRLIKSSAPFKAVHIKSMKVHSKIPKAHWYNMIRSRYASKLHSLSDEEIEDGIAELERERFSALQDDDPVIKTNNVLIVVAEKDR